MRFNQHATAFAVFSCLGGHAVGSDHNLTDFPLEDLMEREVLSASKYAQRIADAPAAVTVLQAADIRQFGYRTLADILRSVRGFSVSSDHQYNYVGIRGFAPPGDYNTRLLILVDGYRINDNIYDTGAISGEFPLDVDLIDRVEIVRGPGSSVYGSNALFGVVNVITRRGRDLNGGEAVAAAGSYNGREGRLSWGRKLESGLEVLISASGLRNDGPTLYFPEFDSPATNNGRTQGTSFERRRQLFGKFEYGPWNLTLLSSRRDQGIPGGAFTTDFDDRGNYSIDAHDSINLGYYRILDNGIEASGRIYTGNYRYRGNYIYGGALNRDVSDGLWWGGEARFVATRDRHKLVYGLEYQRSQRQDQLNYDENASQAILDDRRRSNRYGLYLQDDFTINKHWTLSVGGRLDHDTTIPRGGNFSPRLGVIHRTGGGSVLKLLYGSAYRTPNVYERYYAYPQQQLGNPELRPERIRTWEAVWEKDVGPNLRLVGSVYYYRVQNWIVQEPDPASGTAPYRYENQPAISARGFEFEANRHWQDGTRLRASYTAQFAPEQSAGSLNPVPRHLLKANLSTPLWSPAWRAGLEYQYTSSRTTSESQAGAYSLANGTLLYRPRPHGPEVAFSLYNLFDKRYRDPHTDPGVAARDSIIQAGRTWRLKFTLPF